MEPLRHDGRQPGQLRPLSFPPALHAAGPRQRPRANGTHDRPLHLLRSNRRCRPSSSARARAGSPRNTACCPAAPTPARHATAAARSMAAASKSSASSAAACAPWSTWKRSANARSGSTATSSKPTAARAPPPSTAPCALSSMPWPPPQAQPRLPPLPPIRHVSAAAWPPSASACCDGRELLDLDYSEDKDADVDLNLVMTGAATHRGAGRRRGSHLQPRTTGSTARSGQAGHRRHHGAQRAGPGGKLASGLNAGTCYTLPTGG